MKILFVCHRLPFPPKRGGKIRPFNIIRHMTESGHSVTVGSLARSNDELHEGQGLRDFCDKLLIGKTGPARAMAHMLARVPSTIPSSMGNFYSQSLHRDIRKETSENGYDLIFVHCSSAAQYVLPVNDIPSILDFGDMDSQKWLDYATFRQFPASAVYWLEGTKLLREEKRLARLFDMSTCTTRAELKTLESYGAASSTGWFPNGVDATFFSPSEAPYDPQLICFVGRMDYYPNQQAMFYFCDEVLPQIQAGNPEARLRIVGAEPSKQVRDLAKRQGVEVTGTVPDVRDYVRESALTVAPLAIARGTQNKILESMAMGVPVVSSGIAAAGVDAVPDEHLLAASSTAEYVNGITRLMSDSQERQRLATAARERVLSHHDWAKSMTRVDEIVSRVAVAESPATLSRSAG